MPRTLAADVNSYLAGHHIDFRVLARITFTTTIAHLHTAIGPLYVGSTMYTGLGNFASFEKIREDSAEFTNKIRMRLSGVSSLHLGEALNETIYGKRAELYRCWLREGVVVNTPEMWFAGEMAETKIMRGDKELGNYIDVEIETKLSRRQKAQFYTPESMITAGYSGDTFFDYLHLIPTIRAQWGQHDTRFGGPGQGAGGGGNTGGGFYSDPRHGGTR